MQVHIYLTTYILPHAYGMFLYIILLLQVERKLNGV